MKRIFDTQLIGPFAAMVIVALIVALTTERFLNPGNLSNLSLQVSIVALIAIGSTIVRTFWQRLVSTKSSTPKSKVPRTDE